MSLLELKQQAAALPIEEQAELAAFLAQQLRRDDPAYKQQLTALLDDHDPQHWVRWDEVKKQAGF